MATYTIYSDTSDGYIQSTDASPSYSTMRSGSSLVANTTLTTGGIRAGQAFVSGTTYVGIEGFLSFDTSSVAGDVSAATLDLSGQTDFDGVGGWTVNVRAYDWGSSLTTADWIAGANLSGSALRATFSSSSFTTSGYNTFTSESTFKDNLGSPVRLVVSSSRFEAGTQPASASNGDANDERLYFYAADASGTSNDPKLTIVTANADPVFVMAPRIPAEAY